MRLGEVERSFVTAKRKKRRWKRTKEEKDKNKYREKKRVQARFQHRSRKGVETQKGRDELRSAERKKRTKISIERRTECKRGSSKVGGRG